MRVCLISAVYPPEPVVSARTSAQLARWLVAQGHAVTVITNFPNRPGGTLCAGFRRSWRRISEDPSGIRLVRCFTTLSGKSELLSRFLENLSFGVSSGWALLREPRPDVIYANSWPLFSTALLCLVAGLRRIPVVVSVQDLYPESLVVQQRVRTRGAWYGLLEAIDRWIARRSAALLTISPRFEPIYVEQRRVPATKVHFIPNWIDAPGDDSPATGEHIRQLHGIPDDAFLAVYGGNIGAAAGVETVIRAFGHTSNRQVLLVAGDGSLRDACQEMAAQLSNGRIAFHHPWPDAETSAVYGAADVLVLPTRGRQSLVSLPSKVLGYMASGKPVVALALPGSDLAELIQEARCGWVIPPDDPEALAAKLDEVSKMTEAGRRAHGAAGRDYLARHFSAEVCLPRLGRVLEEAARHA